MDSQELQKRVGAIPYWYHRIELPGGVVTPGWAPINAARYCIPDDLTGLRVLDVGAWDGYWTWEALKRGAREVVAIDDFSDDCGNPDNVKRNGWKTFDLCREAFGFRQVSHRSPSFAGSEPRQWRNEAGQVVSRFDMSVYDIEDETDGDFDIVFFFGTIYHLKHPLLALEQIAKVCDGALYVETASLDEFSPYRGGIGHGFDGNEMVMEFYPGKQYGNNDSNWWAPTLQCLGAMMESVGFEEVQCWPLTETPKDLSECRGFASGTKDPVKIPAWHPAEVEKQIAPSNMKVAAVMSVPRLGFMDNATCAQQALFSLRIPLINVQGAFWGQCLERGLQMLIDSGIHIVLTIDYDTVFSQTDVSELLRLMHEHPEAAAIVPVQRGRAGMPLLMSMHTPSGQTRKDVPLTELQGVETAPIATGHFGLTAIRVKDLLEIPHPWFWDQPNTNRQWGPGRMDADIWFWHQFEQAGKQVLLAPRVTVGHLELMVAWPGADLQKIYQVPGDFHEQGKPHDCWR